MKVVYGHTDSIYVQMPMERAEETWALLNNHVRGIFPNVMWLEEHPVTLEFEKYYESLGVGVTKDTPSTLFNKSSTFLNARILYFSPISFDLLLSTSKIPTKFEFSIFL